MSSYNTYNGSGLGDQLRSFFAGGSSLSRLILINIIVFLIVSVINLILWLIQATMMEGIPVPRTVYWLAVPADLLQLTSRPWTLLSYMFFHEGFFHLLFNMLVLYFGGRIFVEFLGSKRLLATYLMGGLCGAIFYITSYNVFPVFSGQLDVSLALGASASVLAILIAAATYVPQYSVRLFLLGNLKLKHIALFLIILDIFSIQRGNAGGHIAHLGGAFWGFISIYLTRRASFSSLFKLKPSWRRKRKSFSKVYKGNQNQADRSNRTRPLSDEEYNLRKMERQKQTDKILDKIAKGGYESLTREEKEFLFKSGD